MNVQKIQKVTERGQITLPARWRREYGAHNVVVRQDGRKLEIQPLKHVETEEITVFDAIRDNQGKGIKAKDLLTLLNKIKKFD